MVAHRKKQFNVHIALWMQIIKSLKLYIWYIILFDMWKRQIIGFSISKYLTKNKYRKGTTRCPHSFRWRETIVILYGHKKRDSTLDELWEKYHLLRRSVRWLSSRWKCPTRFFYQNGNFFFIEARHSFFQKWALNIFSTFLHRTLKQSRH